MFLNLVVKANVPQPQDPGSRDPTFFQVWQRVSEYSGSENPEYQVDVVCVRLEEF